MTFPRNLVVHKNSKILYCSNFFNSFANTIYKIQAIIVVFILAIKVESNQVKFSIFVCKHHFINHHNSKISCLTYDLRVFESGLWVLWELKCLSGCSGRVIYSWTFPSAAQQRQNYPGGWTTTVLLTVINFNKYKYSGE